MNEKEISFALRSRKIFPAEAVEMRTQLAGLYAFYSEQLEDILMRKPAVWNELRKSQKSDTATERVWEGTADGLNEKGLTLRLKSSEKMMSALKTIIDNANTEYHHNK
jgi:hypothetical protein